MARGQQKIQAQQKNAAAKAKAAKGGTSQKADAAKALKHSCVRLQGLHSVPSICRVLRTSHPPPPPGA